MSLRIAHSDASSPGLGERSGFPGFGEDAPLDLSGLGNAQAAGIVSRIIDKSIGDFSDVLARVGYCSHPVRLSGSTSTVDAATGEVVSTFDTSGLPFEVLYRPCGNRRADVCPACSRTYARDTFEMIKAGLVGGKTVPATVASNPLLFVTLTAPSFGHVHSAKTTKAGKPARCRPWNTSTVCKHGRPLGCMKVHDEADPLVGSAICEDCYDWNSAVVWQWFSSSELFRRTTQNVRRELAKALGVSQAKAKRLASVQYAKVAEYQDRGLVHFHVLIRLDGDDGPGSPAPADGALMASVVTEAVRRTTYTAPPVDARDHARVLAWGEQFDVRVVRDGERTDDPNEPLSAEQVAGYLAKYATKDANSIRNAGKPRPQMTRLTRTCRELQARSKRTQDLRWWLLVTQIRAALDSGDIALAVLLLDRGVAPNPYRLLVKWAHMLGFPGHFGSKSRRYSVTLGQLRRARQRYADMLARGENPAALDVRDLEARLLAEDEDDDTTLVIGAWAYQGSGWPRPGDQALALAAAARAREYDQWRAQQRMSKHGTNSEGE